MVAQLGLSVAVDGCSRVRVLHRLAARTGTMRGSCRAGRPDASTDGSSWALDGSRSGLKVDSKRPAGPPSRAGREDITDEAGIVRPVVGCGLLRCHFIAMLIRAWWRDTSPCPMVTSLGRRDRVRRSSAARKYHRARQSRNYLNLSLRSIPAAERNMNAFLNNGNYATWLPPGW